ncbi:helix-turn-helix transcriptional regulator [Candidatus Poribacteria bacterium]|jgi:DNA-binding transcriptional regulator YiaG|nr:helix-turn-helix transcriptional regulator [Candidatus Poribacteria bacterium]MBT7096607.1 helix-turn-helix transcriptional regulator [Candidatus Poribacteria bacterium]
MPQVGYEVRLYNKGGQYVSAEADDEKDATEKAEAKFEDYFGKAEIAQKIVKRPEDSTPLDMSFHGRLGRSLQRLRVNADKTQKPVAQAVGTSPSQLSKWENGHDEIGSRNADKLLKAIGATVPDLIAEMSTE